MYLILTQYKTIQRAVRNIQRIWKGHKVRVAFLRLLKAAKAEMQLTYFTQMATIIQKM